MKPEQINTAIAEILGWTGVVHYHGGGPLWGISPEGTMNALPDYLESLDACAEFNLYLQNNDNPRYLSLYITTLAGITHDTDGENLVFATAPQRCEAFLRLHGKWEGGQ